MTAAAPLTPTPDGLGARWQELAPGIRATTDGKARPATWFVIDNVPALAHVYDVPASTKNRGLQDGTRARSSTYGAYGGYWSVRSAAEADAMLTEGWPEGLTRVESLVTEVTPNVPPAPNIRRKPTWKKNGGRLHIQRWLRGEPEMWRRGVRQNVPSNTTVTVAFSWGGNCNLSMEEMTWAGVTALAATQMLEEAGYNVGLEAVGTNGHDSGGRHVSVLHLKGTGEAISMGHLAAAVAHSISYRLHELRLSEWCPDYLGYGYGHHLTLRPADLQEAKDIGILEEETFMVGTVRTRQDAVRELTRLVTQLQGDLAH